jgi:hypothetical protein
VLQTIAAIINPAKKPSNLVGPQFKACQALKSHIGKALALDTVNKMNPAISL